jgi:hypothetical protein
VGTKGGPSYKDSILDRVPVYVKNSDAMGAPVGKLLLTPFLA